MSTDTHTNSGKSVWIVIGIVAALLLGCTLGSCTGGLIGYGLSQRNASVDTDYMMPQRMTVVPRATVAPRATAGSQYGDNITPILITRIVQDSPAEKAGLMEGDVIIALGNAFLENGQSFADLIEQYQPGDTLPVTLLRNSRQINTQITVGTNPSQSQKSWLGIYYQQLDAIPSSSLPNKD